MVDGKNEAVKSEADMDENTAEQAQNKQEESLEDFLRSVYAHKEDSGFVAKAIKSVDKNGLKVLGNNPFYIDTVMGLSSQEALEDFIQEIQAPAGPEAQDVQEWMTKDKDVTAEEVQVLLDNWAYLTVICPLKKKDAKNLKTEKIVLDSGAPVCQVVSDDGKSMRMSVSLLGMREGINPDYRMETPSGEDTVIPGKGESVAWKQMMAGRDMVKLLTDANLKNVKIGVGHREMMRNFWALAQVNEINCSGFEPSPGEKVWFEKRERFLTDSFCFSKTQAATKSKGASPMGSQSSDVSSHDEQ